MTFWPLTGQQMKHIIRKYKSCRPAVLVLTVLVCLTLNTPSAAAERRHFLWSVETGKNTVYLMGSIHVLGKDSYPLPQEIEGIYGCCRRMVFETDTEGMNDPRSQMKIMQLGMYPAGQTLSRSVSRETYELLEKRLSSAGLPAARFEQFRPWFAAMTIASVEIMKLGFDPDLGIDRYFFKKALKDGKQLFFLETNEFQINLMAGLDDRLQELFLRTTLKELDVIGKMASDMVGSWMNGDTERLGSILKLSYSEEPEIYRRFLTDRNRRWVPLLERLMDRRGDVLVIVGAGHLVGRDSLVELLKKKGYRVRQM